MKYGITKHLEHSATLDSSIPNLKFSPLTTANLFLSINTVEHALISNAV